MPVRKVKRKGRSKTTGTSKVNAAQFKKAVKDRNDLRKKLKSLEAKFAKAKKEGAKKLAQAKKASKTAGAKKKTARKGKSTTVRKTVRKSARASGMNSAKRRVTRSTTRRGRPSKTRSASSLIHEIM